MNQNHITRELRRNLTPWERKIWNILKNRGLKNTKFRRQFKIGSYVVDFVCLELKLIIEIDGGHHNEQINRSKDQTRQRFLENSGYTILRFWNNEIDHNLEGVTQKICEYL